MELPNISFSYLVAELSPLLEGAYVNKVQELGNDRIKFKVRTRAGTKNLILTLRAPYFTQFKLEARQTTSGYAAFLRKRIEGKKILSFFQHKADRIAVLEFPDCFLIMELFAKGNFVLTDKGMRVLSAYRKEQWSDRETRKGSEYRFPSSGKLSPLNAIPEELQKAFFDSKKDLIRSLVAAVNLSPPVAEQILSDLGLEKSLSPQTLSNPQLNGLAKKMKAYYSVDLKKASPLLYGETLFPFPLSVFGKPEKSFPSVNDAVDELLSKPFLSEKTAETEKKFNKNTEALRRSLEDQLNAREKLENQSRENMKKGEFIYAHFNELQQIMDAAKNLRTEGKKEVMYKMNLLASKGNTMAKKVSLSGKNRLEIDFPD